MQLTDAISIINHPRLQEGPSRIWADLGCGSGLFTLALASLLPGGSEIDAVDQSAARLRNVPEKYKGVHIHTYHQDFTKMAFSKSLDGILMANALHYVEDANAFLKNISRFLQPEAVFVIVEYDTDRSNLWVPYPKPFKRVVELIELAGYTQIEKLGSRPGNFGKEMYGLLAGV